MTDYLMVVVTVVRDCALPAGAHVAVADVVASPTVRPDDRLRALTGACSDRGPVPIVGPVEVGETVNDIAFLDAHGYAPDNEKSRP